MILPFYIVLDGINTEAAEQLFSWLKQYSAILSCLGWQRIPLFLLILFHNKNLERTKVRPTCVFDLVCIFRIYDNFLKHHMYRKIAFRLYIISVCPMQALIKWLTNASRSKRWISNSLYAIKTKA